MSRKVSRPNQQILEEASAWFVAFRSQDLAENAREEFHDWLKRSPEHIRAYLEIAAVYADIPAPEERRTAPELIALARASPDSNVVALDTSGIAVGRSRRPRPHIQRVVLAVSILIFVFLGAWFHAERNAYRTGIGEQRSLTLSDGSIVELNARSKVRLAFSDEQRDVELLEGQALFRVARDHTRAFVVHAGATSVRAVGTQFDVYRKSTGTTVTVLEGRVEILQNLGESPRPLAAGEQITVTPTRAQKAERPNIAAATAWTQHQLVFDGTPLREVLEEFSRYTPRRLVVETPELGALRISGQYTSTSPDSLLRFLRLQKGVVITEVDGEIRIRQE